VLLLKSIGVQRVQCFDFIDPPPAGNLRSSLFQFGVAGLNFHSPVPLCKYVQPQIKNTQIIP
jgi:hypothetical protein